MRVWPTDLAERGRLGGQMRSPAKVNYGAFKLAGPCGRDLFVIAYDGVSYGPDEAGAGWEHVSVSLGNNTRPPNWQEMCFVKEQFWDDDETVLQFHPKKSEYVNFHEGCLHLWRNVGLDHPLPPAILIAPFR